MTLTLTLTLTLGPNPHSNPHPTPRMYTGELEIIAQNIAQLKMIGNQEAVVGNPDSTPLFKQV